jgi:hypothetical protein
LKKYHIGWIVIILIVIFLTLGGCSVNETTLPAATTNTATESGTSPDPSPLPPTLQATATLVGLTDTPPTDTPPTDVPPTATPIPVATEVHPSPTPYPTRAEPLVVETTTDLVFAIGPQEEEWHLDEYAPETPGPWPLVVFLPGSGESKILYKALGEALAGQGFIVSVIDYPKMLPIGAIIGRATGYRAMNDTADCALRFARERVRGGY